MPTNDHVKPRQWASSYREAVPSHDHVKPAHDRAKPAHDHVKPAPAFDGDAFVRHIRNVQHKTKCSTKTCMEFIHLFEQYLDGDLPSDFSKCDKVLKEAAGIDVCELNGCSKCHGHVFGPGDKRTACPLCGHARNDENGKPYEVFSSLVCILPCSNSGVA